MFAVSSLYVVLCMNFDHLKFMPKDLAIFVFHFYQTTYSVNLLYALHYGFADAFKRMLSLKFLMVIDRLGFPFIAGHVLVLKWFYFTKMETGDFSYANFVRFRFSLNNLINHNSFSRVKALQSSFHCR